MWRTIRILALTGLVACSGHVGYAPENPSPTPPPLTVQVVNTQVDGKSIIDALSRVAPCQPLVMTAVVKQPDVSKGELRRSTANQVHTLALKGVTGLQWRITEIDDRLFGVIYGVVC